MADKDARKIGRARVPLDLEGELLHDRDGNQYVVNSDHVQDQLDQRAISDDKYLELQLARELLSSDLRQLTQRQKDVLYFTMQGLTEQEIGDKLGIAQQVVAKHLERARRKLAGLINQTKEVLQEETEDE